MQLDGTRILVTGGAGLVGSTTVDLLLRTHAPREVVVLDNLSRGSLDNLAQAATDPRLKFVRGDVRDPACAASTRCCTWLRCASRPAPPHRARRCR
jgi:UDP-glucose 4-epimerase